tara:strand:- start:6375 stop:7130 length:756 start_codon:yes stop_codon:yes gene_type:complete
MIKTLEAFKQSAFLGIVVYEGPSKIDGKPIVAIANKIDGRSRNAKTGAMVQTWIMRSDIAPHHAVKTGDDKSVCGDCPLRPLNNGESVCYVKTFQAPLSVYNAYHNRRYARPGVDFDAALIPAIFAGLSVRFGSYGDPYAVPVKFWSPMAKRAANWTGYSHQWRKAGKTLATLCMASADNADDVVKANAKGWRTFRVRKSNAPKLANEFVCPASKEGGTKTNCAACGLCAGNSIIAKNPVIMDHGSRKARL